MLNIQIVKICEVKELQFISKSTFSESFAKDNTEENLQDYFNQAFSVEALSLQINNPFSRFFFVYFEGNLCGYFKINIGESQTEIKDNDGLELERIYILAEHQGKKIGEKIIAEIKKIALTEQKKYIWLGVWEQNLKAIRFYERLGFIKFDTHIYPIGNDPQVDWMMRLTLN